MIGYVIYCTSMILLMIDSFCQKISGSMLLPYIFLQSLMGITLLACSIILNLMFIILRYPHWNIYWQMLFVTMTFVAVIVVLKKKGFGSLIYVPFLTMSMSISMFCDYVAMWILIWSLLEIKKTYEFLDKATSLEKSEQ